MSEFVSDWIMPSGGVFETSSMGRGLPGLPTAFEWRGERRNVVEVLEQWKASGPEKGRLRGERYLRRHYWRLRMSDESEWVVYFVRHAPPGGSRKRRWFLYSIDRPRES